MKIAIIGSGNVGGALALQLKKAGHTILIGARFPLSQKSIALAQKIGEDHFAVTSSAVKQSDVIIITTPPQAVFSLIDEMGDVSSKVLIDASNSVRAKPDPYPTVFHALKALTKNTKIVKCFNTTGFENMQNPVYNGVGIDMFHSGSDADANAVAIQLSKDVGFENCYYFGNDDTVELLEKFALSWINLAIIQGHGRNMAFKILKR
jgi:predicted dinucleotide-binding enzyme